MINWYMQSGKESDVVISSRIRLARNLREYPFFTKITKEQQIEIINGIKDNLLSIGYGLKLIKLSDIDDITKISLVEKHLISPDFIKENESTKAILINDEENICIMINEEDHFRIQVFSSGLDIENAMNLAVELDEKLQQIFNIAVDERYGFLTSCPTNVGTGLKASIMVHLPALSKTGNIRKILEVINNFGMNIRGTYGEGSDSKGDIYQISNKQSIGISEKEIIKNIKLIILTNCKKISCDESMKLLSEVKLGTDLGIIKELTDLKVMKLMINTKPANLQKIYGKKFDTYERDIKRAEMIKQIVNEN